ncbi:prepilin peptidase [Allofrancisella frigidaquae]|uniref:Prepilin leader peptidase/N-methyltransferase n=1 Tax=Allofrancisella frigidaquae TaxID=1085644 RepID=A0A6M3HTF6_9GAMM|nr:A24 family peptidase [Allofrancisella frigidaquae]QIV94465.1 prepilin peptidase [Allofrancisella frigidaquae]
MFDTYVVLFFTFLFGAAIGSFLNVLAFRLPEMIEQQDEKTAKEILNIIDNEAVDIDVKQQENILRPSKCPKCSNKLKYRHNIPILGWFLLKGKCYFCKVKISIQYPLVELVTAISFCIIIYLYGVSWQAFALILLFCFFIPLLIIDLKHYILPDELTLPLIWIGLIINSYEVFTSLNSAVWGAILGYLSLWSIYWIYKSFTAKEGFGYGDFKLLAAIGAWFGYQMLIYAIFASCIIGLIIAGLINLFGRRTNVIAFGPSIILASIFYLATKDNLYIWYNHVMLIQSPL